MSDPFDTRAPRASDIPALAAIAAATLFPGEMLEGMISPALDGAGQDLWRVVRQGGTPVGFAFAQPEAMADRAWFYVARGYAEDAVIPGFFGEGEDKVPFVKVMR